MATEGLLLSLYFLWEKSVHGRLIRDKVLLRGGSAWASTEDNGL